jgi:hypothetical protein
MFIFVSCENFKLTKKFSNLYNMLEEELDDLTRKRSELDDIIADLYELKPLLEKCESDTVLKEYNECDVSVLSLAEWYIRTKPLFKYIVSWLKMYYEQKLETKQETDQLKQKIKTLRHSVLASFNKS